MTSWTPRQALALVAEFPELQLVESLGGDLIDPIHMGAVFSDEDRPLYRYMLWRIFDPALPMLVAIMLNPSTATHENDDRTIAGLVARARRLGFGGILVVNCFAFRATEPKDMKLHPEPIGRRNDDAIRHALAGHGNMVLCAWGVDGVHLDRQEEVACVIARSGSSPYALKLCANGAPAHPLYIAHTVLPFEWRGTIQNS